MWWSRFLGYVAVAAVLVLCSSLVAGSPVEASSHRRTPAPVLRGAAFGDPSVVTTGRARVVVATGPRVVRAVLRPGARHWRWRSHALVRLPRWARRGPVWGPDLARLGPRHWVLYYAAPVRGLGGRAHCIGVATARAPYATFRPVGRRPLVCMRGARTPRAADMARSRRAPRRGVIDPSYFRKRNGRAYLVYKTAGRPSTIRILPLTHNGLGRRPHTRSVELVRSRGIIENPVLLRRRHHYYLLASEGSWSSCRYRETWRASRTLLRWRAGGRPLLTRLSTHGICGPGGADVTGSGRHRTIYFHGWVHRGTGIALRTGRRAGRGARRAMYAARLRWRHGRPVIGRYVSR